MKKVLFLLFLSLSGNKPSENRIAYRQLTWADFQGQVPNQCQAAARTYSQLAWEKTEYDGLCSFVIKAYFLPDSSFVRLPTPEALRHEQTHFLIAYIASLRCMRDLQPFQDCESRLAYKGDSVYQHYFEWMSDREDRFDRETDHGRLTKEENQWEAQMSRELHILETSSNRVHGRNR